MADSIERFNEIFKLGRRAGQEDVCLEILRYDRSFAHQIAREYLSRIPGHEAMAKAIEDREI